MFLSRPDFVKGHIGLARALRLAGEAAEARQVLLNIVVDTGSDTDSGGDA